MDEDFRTPKEIQLSESKLELEIAKLEKEGSLLDIEFQRKTLELDSAGRYVRSERAKADEARVFPFYGSVSGSAVASAISKLSDWSRRDPGEPIEIVFNSPGGSVIDGLALFDYIQELRSRGTHITTITMGMAASMGGVLLQAGDVRVASKNSVLLIHEVSAGTQGKVSEMEDHLKFMEVLQGKCLEILADRSSMTARQIATKWKKTDWWLSADEALKLGFVDAVR